MSWLFPARRKQRAATPFEQALGYVFRDPDRLTEALTHPSWCGQHREDRSNQRLEFLGDAVLELILTDELFRRFPDHRECDLTNLRASFACSASLAEKARSLGVGPMLRLDKGAAKTGGADNRHNLEDAMESIIGAIYLDGGLADATAFVLRLFGDDLASCRPIGAAEESPRSALLALAQGTYRCTPEYGEVSQTGPDSAPEFTASVSVNGVSATGTGRSKRAAQAAAAAALLSILSSKTE